MSFSFNLKFLEPQVEEENKIEQCKKGKEVEEFIKEQRNPKKVKKRELDCNKIDDIHTKEIFRNKRPERNTA